MDLITPEQQAQLSSWASKRDSVLREISVAEERLQTLTKINQNLGESNTDIETRIQQSVGRLSELDAREEDRKNLLRKDTADLLAQVSELQTKIACLTGELSGLETSKKSLVETIEHLSQVHTIVFGAVERMEEFVSNTSKSNSENAKEIEGLLEKVRHELQKIIDVNAENVGKTNVVIEKLPRIIFELQRDIIERKRLARVKTG